MHKPWSKLVIPGINKQIKDLQDFMRFEIIPQKTEQNWHVKHIFQKVKQHLNTTLNLFILMICWPTNLSHNSS